MNRIFLLFLSLSLAVSLQAQVMGNNIVVTVQPDHQDWIYQTGEKATFTVNVLKSGTLLDDVQVDYEVGPVMYPEVKKSETLKKGSMTYSATMKQPGFYRFKVWAHVGGKDYAGLCTAAFSPSEIKDHTECPNDFDAFWQKAIEEARRFDLNPRKTLLADRCTKEVNVYEVSFTNNNPNGRVYGILCVPVKPGKYPALLRVPGAGVRPYNGDIYTASRGAVTLEIGIHGISVTMPQKVYNDLANYALNGYWDTNLDQPNKNYYKKVVTGCIRAVDYIASLPEWDGQRIGVSGSSQGGFLSLATTALDKRITCYAAVHTALCDHLAVKSGVAPGWPQYFFWNKNASEAQLKGSQYYDGVNFAKRIQVPGWFSFGYNDETVSPNSAYAAYNAVTAPKELSLYQLTGHYWYQEQWEEWQNWLIRHLGIE